MTRYLMRSLLASVALVGCAGPTSDVRSGESFAGVVADRPHVILLVVDALRADRLGANGYRLPTTPNLDRLVAEGINFTNAFSHSTWTKASVTTLFTSRFPREHGLGRQATRENDGYRTDVLPKRAVTLAERFWVGGYRTVAVVNNPHLTSDTGIAQGFEDYGWMRGQVAPRINERLFRWWDEKQPKRPVFAYLHYLDVHWPYERVLPGRARAFGEPTLDPPPPADWDEVEAWAHEHLDEKNLAALEARYDREVEFADHAIGELVAELKRRGLWETTLLAVTSDHGEGFYEHRKLQHGYEPYDEVTRIPWVIRLPDETKQAATVVDAAVGLVDVGPTLVHLASLEPIAAGEGRSRVPEIIGAERAEGTVYGEGAGTRSLRSQAHKVMLDDGGSMVCFDLKRDPGEQEPERISSAGECKRLAADLTALDERLAGSMSATELIDLPADRVEHLKSLGYLAD